MIYLKHSVFISIYIHTQCDNSTTIKEVILHEKIN